MDTQPIFGGHLINKWNSEVIQNGKNLIQHHPIAYLETQIDLATLDLNLCLGHRGTIHTTLISATSYKEKSAAC